MRKLMKCYISFHMTPSEEGFCLQIRINKVARRFWSF